MRRLSLWHVGSVDARRDGCALEHSAELVDVAVDQVDERVLAAADGGQLRHPPRPAPHPAVVVHLPRDLDRRALGLVRREGEAAGPRDEADVVRDGHAGAVHVRHAEACRRDVAAAAASAVVHGTRQPTRFSPGSLEPGQIRPCARESSRRIVACTRV
jgi:hypothetical protein